MTLLLHGVVIGLATPKTFAMMSTIISPINRARSLTIAMNSMNEFERQVGSQSSSSPFHITVQSDVDVTQAAEEITELMASTSSASTSTPVKTYELGHDPRGPLPEWATPEEIAHLDARSSKVPKPATASKSPYISSIQTVSELDAAIATHPLVVVKFYMPSCRACFKMKPYYEQFAKGATESTAVLEVDTDASRLLVQLVGVKNLPCVHIYKEGTLVARHRIGNMNLFTGMQASFQQHLDDYRAHPDSTSKRVKSFEIPPSLFE